MVVVTKYHKLGGSDQQTFLSQSFGDWKSEVKMLAGLVPSGAVKDSHLIPSYVHRIDSIRGNVMKNQ